MRKVIFDVSIGSKWVDGFIFPLGGHTITSVELEADNYDDAVKKLKTYMGEHHPGETWHYSCWAWREVE